MRSIQRRCVWLACGAVGALAAVVTGSAEESDRPSTAPPADPVATRERSSELPVMFFWTEDVVPDRETQGFAYFMRLASAQIEAKQPSKPSVFAQDFGSRGSVAVWLNEFADLAALQTVRNWAQDNSAYQAELDKSAGLFVPGRSYVSILLPCAGRPVDESSGPAREIVHWVARAKPSALDAARALAVRLTDRVNARADGVTASAYVEMFGRVETLHWFLCVGDIPTWGRVYASLCLDDEFVSLRRDLFALCDDDVQCGLLTRMF